MSSETDRSSNVAMRDTSSNSRSVSDSLTASVRLESLGKSGSSFISAYDALIRACAEERTRSLAAGLAGVERRSGAGVGAVDEAQTLTSNEAVFAVAAGNIRSQHMSTNQLVKGFGRKPLARQNADHPVSDARRQQVGPLFDSLISDADSNGGIVDRAAQKFDCFDFFHAPLEHSSDDCVSIVQIKFAMVNTMTEYRERLRQAMGSSISIAQLACALDISYQAVKKLLDGKSTSFTAINNTKAARYLGVNPDWLATGTGEMMAQYSPEPDTDGLTALADKLSYLDTASRETAATLLAGMARAPKGPWAGWLAELLTGKQENSLQNHNTLADKTAKTDKARIPLRGTQKSIFNLGEFDGGQRAISHEHHPIKHSQK